MIRRIFFITFILNIIIPGTAGAAKDGAALAQIAQANAHYAKLQYKEAADLYQDLVNRGFENGYLYYNLGNAYLRLEQIGPAILNYIRAKRLLPRDESLTANLNHSIQKTRDQLGPGPGGGWSAVFFWVKNFNQTEHLIVLAAVNALFWTAAGFWIVRGTEFWNLSRMTLMTLLILSVLSFGVKIYNDAESTAGVVLAKTIAVKSGQGENNVTLFQLHEGAVVSIIDRKNGWVHIELNDGKKGWAQERSIGV